MEAGGRHHNHEQVGDAAGRVIKASPDDNTVAWDGGALDDDASMPSPVLDDAAVPRHTATVEHDQTLSVPPPRPSESRPHFAGLTQDLATSNRVQGQAPAPASHAPEGHASDHSPVNGYMEALRAAKRARRVSRHCVGLDHHADLEVPQPKRSHSIWDGAVDHHGIPGAHGPESLPPSWQQALGHDNYTGDHHEDQGGVSDHHQRTTTRQTNGNDVLGEYDEHDLMPPQHTIMSPLGYQVPDHLLPFAEETEWSLPDTATSNDQHAKLNSSSSSSNSNSNSNNDNNTNTTHRATPPTFPTGISGTPWRSISDVWASTANSTVHVRRIMPAPLPHVTSATSTTTATAGAADDDHGLEVLRCVSCPATMPLAACGLQSLPAWPWTCASCGTRARRGMVPRRGQTMPDPIEE